jgi:hypothetical protein
MNKVLLQNVVHLHTLLVLSTASLQSYSLNIFKCHFKKGLAEQLKLAGNSWKLLYCPLFVMQLTF